MQMTMRVTFNDASKTTKDCAAIFADFVAFERTWNRSVAKFTEELRLTDIAWLAWKSEIRCKNTQETFDLWLEKVGTIDLLSDEEEDAPEEVQQATAPLD
jgi:hypothetical protein